MKKRVINSLQKFPIIIFNFNLSGGTEQPDVIVNPLSLFTPGMFREIFRRKPPEQE